MAHSLTLYTRSYCSLCDKLLLDLQACRQQYGFQVELVDVDTEPALEREFGDKVPLLMGAGKEICHYFFDPEALARYFASL